MRTTPSRLFRLPRAGRPLLVALLATLPSVASAITFTADTEQMRFETLIARSEAAAVLQVDSVRYRWVGTRLVTDYTCRVLQAGFGVDADETLIITQPGGEWNGIGQKVMGLESFSPNDHLAVLLGARGYLAGGRPITGMVLGAMRVLEDGHSDAAAPDTPLLPLFSVNPVLRDAVAGPQTVGEFLERVRR